MTIGTKSRADLFRVGAWNVRSLKHKEAEVVEEVKSYRLEVLGVSETCLKGCSE